MFGKRSGAVPLEGQGRPNQQENPQKNRQDTVSAITTHILNITEDNRPYLKVTLFNHPCIGLLDSGASITVKKICPIIRKHQDALQDTTITLKAANKAYLKVLGEMVIPLQYKGQLVHVPTIIVDELAQDLLLGYDFWKAVGFKIIDEEEAEVSAVEPHPRPRVETEVELQKRDRVNLEKAMSKFLITTDDFLGRTHVLEHRIELIEGARPFVQRSHLFSPTLQEKVNVELDDMLRRGIVKPSKSPVASPVVPVIKSNGAVRLCLDSRKLNSITKKDQFPVPNLNHIFARMERTKYLSTIDLSKAFWQVPLSQEEIPGQFANSGELTAFVIPGRGLFEFCVMPFGLCNSPATQCRLMYRVLGHDLEPKCFVYMDDVLLLSQTVQEMIELIKKVAERLTGAGLSINIDKCKFFARSVKYLGYVISEEGMAVDPGRVVVMVEYPTPKTIKSVRRFLGLTGYYRRLIKDYSGIASPLTNLLRGQSNRLQWTEGASEAFERLKKAMYTAPVIANPDFKIEFQLQCDASNLSAASALGQVQEGQEVVVAYFSHKWNTTESNWGATEKEAASVLYSIRHFKSYIWGRHFTVITDAQALTHIRTLKTDGSSRLARWALELNSYDVTVKHRSGKLSVVPDALSRAVESILAVESEQEEAWYKQIVTKITQNPENYPDFQMKGSRLLKYEAAKNDIGCFEFVWKEYVPETQRAEIIKNTHQTLCHLGGEKCAEFLRHRYFWPGMKSNIEKDVRSCDVCKATKAPHQNTRVPMGRSRNASYPFQMVAIDHWGPITRSRRGNTCLLIVVDIFSKFVLLHPKRDTGSESVVRFLEEEVFLKFGTPQTLISDNHKPLIGRNMVTLLNKYGINHWTIPAYHSQANPAERYLRTVGAAIRAKVMSHDGDHRSWDEEISMIQWAINSTMNETTQKSPYFINFGREPTLRGDEQEEAERTTDRNEMTAAQLTQKFEALRSEVQAKIHQAQGKFRTQYDKGTRTLQFQLDERAWRRNRELSSAAQHFSQRLAPKYVPCQIIERLGRDTYKVRDEGGTSWHRVHANDLLKD